MSSRLIAAVEAFLKRLEHLVGLEPTASVTAHVPVPELLELRAAHAEAIVPESPTPTAAEPPSDEGEAPEFAAPSTAAPETEPPA